MTTGERGRLRKLKKLKKSLAKDRLTRGGCVMSIFFSAYLPAVFLLRDPDDTTRHCKYTNTPHFVPSQAVWLCGTISRACSGVRSLPVLLSLVLD